MKRCACAVEDPAALRARTALGDGLLVPLREQSWKRLGDGTSNQEVWSESAWSSSVHLDWIVGQKRLEPAQYSLT